MVSLLGLAADGTREERRDGRGRCGRRTGLGLARPFAQQPAQGFGIGGRIPIVEKKYPAGQSRLPKPVNGIGPGNQVGISVGGFVQRLTGTM